MDWLVHCNTGSVRKYNLSVPCSVLLSNNRVAVKACISLNLNLLAAPIQDTAKHQHSSSCQAFLSRSSFVPWQRKVGKMHLLCNRTLFNPSSFNFCYSESSVISPQVIKLCISLLSQSLRVLCNMQCHRRSSINSDSYLVVVNKTINSEQSMLQISIRLGYYCSYLYF